MSAYLLACSGVKRERESLSMIVRDLEWQWESDTNRDRRDDVAMFSAMFSAMMMMLNILLLTACSDQPMPIANIMDANER